MTQEVRLIRGDRRHAIFNAYPLPRVRVSVPPRPVHVERDDTTHTDPTDAGDDLRAARGILFIGLSGVALWAMIGIMYWLIAR